MKNGIKIVITGTVIAYAVTEFMVAGDKIPHVIEAYIKDHTKEVANEVERDFKNEVKNDTQGFQKSILAANRGAFAKGVTNVSDIEKMICRKLKLLNQKGSKDIRYVSYDIKYEDFTSFKDRTERRMMTATWKICFEFDENEILLRYWLE